MMEDISPLEREKPDQPPDYSNRHENLGGHYEHLWKSSSERLSSRILWFLLLVLYVLFISIPILQGLIARTLANLR